ncbi:SusC/RagA family TonB-linked outer membrane protein [Chitinophaga defluvii]|uniref:TonB-dependent receptor n=1 Tax=Chitinophaga defluvii TaxID=3163343 RepID=A0ABV2TBH5_9BACT
MIRFSKQLLSRCSWLFAALWLLSLTANAQNTGGTITGVVKNEKGETLPGVTVGIINADSTFRKGQVTDGQGVFLITDIPAGGPYTISFTSIGYNKHQLKDYRLAAGEKVSLLIRLKESATELNQLVVIGYGTQKKSNVSTSIATVGSEFIGKQSILRVEQALQGSAPGVLVLSPSGQPGEKPMIRIRGTGTNKNPDPLYIVDGFPVNDIEYLNPNDIERMDVLKDAASAAIYGARGANGVVLITTKSGKKGPARISYDGYYGIQNAWRKVPVLNGTEYAEMMNEGARNANQAEPFTNPSQYGKGTNWQDATFQKNAPITSHNVAVSGGNENSTYFTSFSYFGQQGIVGGDRSQFERYTIRLNGDQKVKDFLRIGVSLSYMNTSSRGINSNADYGGVLNNSINLDPLTPVYETDPDKLNNPVLYPANAVRNGNQIYGISSIITDGPTNPLAAMALANSKNKNDKILGNAYGEVDIWKGLKFRSSLGIEVNNYSSSSFTPGHYLNSATKTDISLVGKGFSRRYTWQVENVLSYNRTFDKHNVQALLGHTALKSSFENLGGSRPDLITSDPNMAYIDLATNETLNKVNGGADVRSLLSYFGRIAYDYDGKYLLSGTLRRDGSSRFGRNNPFATFPSVSAGWVVSREGFFESNTVTFLKLRGSWGQNGNENIGDNSFPWAAGMVLGNGYTFIQPTGEEYYLNGVASGAVPNPNLKWETSEQTNFGVDVELWKGKLAFTADYYNKKTIGLLFNPPIMAIVGNPSPYVNGGSVSNKGVELGITYKNQVNNDLSFNVTVNGAYNKNNVIDINNAAKAVAGAGYIGAGAVTRMQIGNPIGYLWGYKTDGIFQNQQEIDEYTKDGKKIQPKAVPGDLKFVDLNGDGKLDNNDKTIIGDPNPDVTAGINLNVTYKQFDFSMFAVGMFGHQLLNGLYRYDIKMANMPRQFLDRWTEEGSDAKFPRFTFADNNGNHNNVSDVYIENASYVRIKNIQIGYTFPEALVKKAKLNNLRVYVAADNPFTFTKYTGFDPEIGARDALNLGIDHGVYPQARAFRVGVNVNL